MTVSNALLLSWWAGMLAVLVGTIAAIAWARFASKITDIKIKSAIIYCLLAIILLTLSEAAYVKQALVTLESAPFSPEEAEESELLEYLRYFFISAGFIMLVLAANAELNISRTYTFVGSRFKKARSRISDKNQRQGIKQKL